MKELFRTHKKTNATGKIILGAIAGVAAGFTAGILTAPRAGKETRHILSAKASEAAEKAGETISETKEKTVEAVKSKQKPGSSSGL